MNSAGIYPLALFIVLYVLLWVAFNPAQNKLDYSGRASITEGTFHPLQLPCIPP